MPDPPGSLYIRPTLMGVETMYARVSCFPCYFVSMASSFALLVVCLWWGVVSCGVSASDRPGKQHRSLRTPFFTPQDVGVLIQTDLSDLFTTVRVRKQGNQVR